MVSTVYFYFTILTLLLIGLDIWQTRNGLITPKKALVWSVMWVILAFVFAISIYYFWPVYAPNSFYSAEKATIAFITGYLLEKSLSIDNLFVFAIIFQQYQVPDILRSRALLWGIIGSIILRAIMIIIGAQLLEQYHWLLYIFALFLIWTGYKLASEQGEHQLNPLPERLIRKIANVTDGFRGEAIVIYENKQWLVTPMLLVLMTIAFMDVMFALDSIPAIFAVTREPFLVISANVFALLGLRSLYFVLQGMIDKFIYLKPALSFIMIFIGIKMLLAGSRWEIPIYISLSVLVITMTVAVVASVIKQKKNEAKN